MRKSLLTGVAALSVCSASAAHADTLPNEMLGRWCQDDVATQTGRRVYTRGACDDLRVSRNNIVEYVEDGCDFKRIKRLPNGSYFVQATCGAAGGGITNEDMMFQIVDKQLVIITTTVRFCVSVIEPPPNVVQDPEFDPKGWLGLREKPDTRSRIIFRLGDGEYLEADAVKGDWTHISNVTRLSQLEGKTPAKIVQGWVRSKYVKKFLCEHETKSEDTQEESSSAIPGTIPGLYPPGTQPETQQEPEKCYPKWMGGRGCPR